MKSNTPPLVIADVVRAHLRKRHRHVQVPISTLSRVARALLPVQKADVSGPRGVWRSWIEVVEYALEEPTTASNPPCRHARQHLLAVIAVVASLDDANVEHVIRTVVSMRDELQSKA